MSKESVETDAKMISTLTKHEKLGQLRILLPGVPSISSRGYLGYCTVVLFTLNGEWALFDTGHYNDRHLLIAGLNEAGLASDDIRHVILSHLHFDHTLNLPLFKKAAVCISQAELDYAKRVQAGEVIDHSIPDFWPLLLENRQIQIVEDTVELSSSVKLVHLPGHTPGCMAMFYGGPSTVAVCGDVIKNAWEAATGESALALADRAAARSSIEAVRQQASVVIPGHDRPFVWDEKGIQFLTAFSWEIRTSLYPDEQNKSALKINLPADAAAGRQPEELTDKGF